MTTGENPATIETLPDDAISPGEILHVSTPDRTREHRFAKIEAMGPDNNNTEIRLAEKSLETPFELFAEIADSAEKDETTDGAVDVVRDETAREDMISDIERVREDLTNVNDDDQVAEMEQRLTSVVERLRPDES